MVAGALLTWIVYPVLITLSEIKDVVYSRVNLPTMVSMLMYNHGNASVVMQSV
jgi:hypothetical protein